MEDTGALGIVQIILGALGTSGALGGIASIWMHWHSTRAKVSADERQAKADRMSALEAEIRAKDELILQLRKGIRQRDDYANLLRDGYPGTPPAWPADLIHY